MRRLITCALFLAATLTITRADNWPRWRGPDGTGQSREKNLPLKWSVTDNVKWKTVLPGPGMSSPIVWRDRVFLTQSLDRDGHRRALMCIDRKDGKLLWQKVTEYPDKESTYSGEPHYCSSTPATDGERIIASFGSAGLVCYDFAGKMLWKKDLGKAEQIWGNASSPVIYRNLCILNFGPGERTFLVGLDKRTGKDIWRVDEPGAYGTDQKDWIGSWATPVVATIKGRDELIMLWPDAVKAYNPLTGTLIWSCKGMGKLVYNSPLITPDVIVAMSGFGGPHLAVKTGGSGDVTATHRLWREERTTQRVGSGVVVGEHVYIVNENGIAQCIVLNSGKTLWTERACGRVWGSMVHADGRLYVTDQQGETVVLAAKPVFEVLARNPLSEKSQSSAAISDGELFIRTYGHLWCIGESKGRISR